jgi:hypothetical protein
VNSRGSRSTAHPEASANAATPTISVRSNGTPRRQPRELVGIDVAMVLVRRESTVMIGPRGPVFLLPRRTAAARHRIGQGKGPGREQFRPRVQNPAWHASTGRTALGPKTVRRRAARYGLAGRIDGAGLTRASELESRAGPMRRTAQDERRTVGPRLGVPYHLIGWGVGLNTTARRALWRCP